MSELIAFPDVELWFSNYLRTGLAAHGYPGVYVSNAYKGRDLEVWVRRDGGIAADRFRDVARLGINVFAKSPTTALVADLARVVSALVRAAPDGRPVVKVTQIAGPTSVADAVPRLYMTFEVTTRGSSLT